MSSIDFVVTEFMSELGGRNRFLDGLVLTVLPTPTFRIFPLLIVLAWLWRQENHRMIVFSGIVSGFAALLISRLVQNVGFHRPRPIYSGDFHFHTALKLPPDWSSFPSDTSALAFALATSAFIISRRSGLIALGWATFAVGFAKIYAGAHYPSDILAGGLIGASCSIASIKCDKISNGMKRVFNWAYSNHQPTFHVIILTLTFQLATFFDDIRRPATLILGSFNVK